MRTFFLFILIIIMFFLSCHRGKLDFGEYIPMGKEFMFEYPYKVIAIKDASYTPFGGYTKRTDSCKYILSSSFGSGKDFLIFIDNLLVIDSVGNFNINDSVYFNMIKKEAIIGHWDHGDFVDAESSFRISKIDKINETNYQRYDKDFCIYSVRTYNNSGNKLFRENTLSIVDSIGKFKLNDKVYFKMIKY